MTRFTDGPAMGAALSLRRAPLFLRVVFGIDGQVDALDQLNDQPDPAETITVYRRKGKAGTIHIDYTDKKTRRRRGAWFAYADYKLSPVQPPDDVMRSTEAWRGWCLEQVAKDNRAHPKE